MDITFIIITLSVFAQFIAAILSVRLILVTRKRLAGILILTMTLLMTFRRCISLYRITTGGAIRTDLVAEITALIISLLLLSGILFITKLLLSSGKTNESLRISEERFRLSWQTIADSLTITTIEDGVFVDVNPGFTGIFGYTREESLGKSSLELGIWEDPEDRQRLVNDLKKHGVATIQKGRFRRKDGTRGFASFFARMIMLDGRPHILLVAKDITEQDKTEETLKQNEERLRLALAAANQGLYDLNVQTGETTITAEYATMLGYDPDDFRETNEKWIERLHPEDRGPVAAVYRDYISGKIPIYSVEFRQKTRKGDWKWILSLGKIVERDTEGRPLRMLGTHTDITARKESEEALRESEKRIRDITASLGEGIYVLDTEGTITFMNPMAERLWGWTMEELNETRAHNRVHFQRADGTPLPIEACRMLNVLKTGRPFSSTDEVFIRKDGTVFPISVITAPIMEGERVVGSVTAFRDITEEKKMEAELLKAHKLESLGILAGGIAHDFNNLLQAIMGNVSLARMLLGGGTAGEVPALLEQAEEASEAARELSFRLLTFSKGGEPVRKTSSIGAIIRKSVSLSLSGSAVTCTVDLPPDLPPVEIDEGQMTQVFNNLLINAKEAMPQGGTIIIRGENLFVPGDSPLPLDEGAYVSIMVQDSGLGIPEEILPKIFDPYFSAKGLGSRKGSGLGLAIALSIVKKHEGHITVDSLRGKGTTFRVYLPVSKAPLQVRRREEESPGDMIPKRLLFMD